MTRAQLAVSKVSLSRNTRERVMLRTEATIDASMVMLCTETIFERKTGVNYHADLRELSMAWCLWVILGDPQSGFVPEGGTTVAIFVVRQMQEKCLAVNKHIYMTVLALQKAFYRVPRNFIWWELRKLCYPGSEHQCAKPCLCCL